LNSEDSRVVENLLQQKMGAGLTVEILKGEPPQEKEVVRVATPESLVGNDPIVQEFVKTFKGKISKIELKRGNE
jgi:hypothetical protein